ncbi:MAG: 3-phosphoshikimate 1-carboxyvinyltransferase 1 [Chlamydiae bacterium]|nr:3-phosphoshikimate 1-carboxyvinyltransferase 1 [Chlamydiota bacterium]
MTSWKLSPSKLVGSIAIPPSKSHTMRALLFASLGKGVSEIKNYLPSPDIFSCIEAIRSFGIPVEVSEKKLLIRGAEGRWNPCASVIDAGNSGQILRFVGALASLLPTYTVLTGDHSIRTLRPVTPFLSALSQLGASATSTKLDSHAPILIRGPIKPGHATLSGEDSQPVSALLMATSFLEGKSVIEVKNPGETPWIDLTLSWIHSLGGKITHQNYTHYEIEGSLKYEGFQKTIPGDFSSAAFPLVAALLTNSQISLENLDWKDIQGDKQLITILMKMGAPLQIYAEKKSISINNEGSLQGRRIDVNRLIDALPILAVVGCFAEGNTEIYNAGIARKKESDRITTITKELRKMGANIEENPDGLIIYPTKLKGASLYSHNDHRIAMALAVAALAAEGESVLDGVECVEKSYPNFLFSMQHLGAKIK